MQSPQLQLEAVQVRFRDYQEFSVKITAIMNCFLQEKEHIEEEAKHERQRLLDQHEQAIARKNITIQQLSATVESLSLVLRGCRDELQQVRGMLEQKGWQNEDLRKAKDTEIAILKEKLQEVKKRSPSQSSWYTSSTQPTVPNCQDVRQQTAPLKMCYYNKPLDWRQSVIHQPSYETHDIVLLDRTNRLTGLGSNNNVTSARSTCSNTASNILKEEPFTSTPSCGSRPALEGFAVGKENLINKPVTTISKHRKNTTFLKKRDQKQSKVRQDSASFGINHNRSTSQHTIPKTSKGDLKSLKRLSHVMS